LLKTGALQNAILNSANFSSIATDAKGVIQIFNVGAERMLGYAAADVLNKITPAEISDPQEVVARAKTLSVELGTAITPGFEALVFKASRGIEDIYELTYIRKDGSRFPAVVSVTALRDAQEVIIGYLLIGTDNTARKEAEAALLKAGALQSAIFNSANFSSIATDAKGVIQIFNVGAERMLGYAAADVMNKITPADISDSPEIVARAKALSVEFGTPITPGFEALVFKATRAIEDIYELTYIRKDGSRFPAVVSVTALRDAQEVIIGYLLIGTDNTARKEAEAALLKAGALQSAIFNRAEQLALASKYKSQFLANMSHELRTPLSSLLILARILGDNADANLTAKQVEFAKTIHAAGKDLLSLINDILDLSKIESGTISVEAGEVSFKELREHVERGFRQMAEQKGLDFTIELEPSLGTAIFTDSKRLQQVLRNLLANSLKFTEKGKVSLRIGVARDGWTAGNDVLDAADTVLSFRVTDTGIGIPADKQKIIFEAFQQADGTTSRKFGGTGLGLSISREIARLLGGEIQVESAPGKGSTFTFYLPEVFVALEGVQELPSPSVPSISEPISKPLVRTGQPEVIVDTAAMKGSDAFALRTLEDDRESLQKGDRVLLVIEDDPRFAKIVLDMARERGFKVVVAERGDIGLALANELQPDAITLDIQLPVIDGWAILGRLKRNPRTRHIPVHVISVMDRQQRGVTMGAFAYLEKPVDKDALDGAFVHLASFLENKVRRLLLVEDNPVERASLEGMLGEGEDMEVVSVSSADEALKALELSGFDCMVVDLMLPGIDGFDLIDRLKKQARFHDLPIVAYTGKNLSAKEEARLLRNVETVVVKGGLRSSEHLLADTALFLGRVEAKLPDHVKNLLREERDSHRSLAGKKVLVVDDDIRNIFALTAVLENHHMFVVCAESGRAGIELLERTTDIDLVMMDIMMPEMDGYETIREIRKQPQFRDLPIIAVTAQALKEDKEKCLAAGASDYLPKPVEQEKLLELCQLWIRTTSSDSWKKA